MIVSNFKLAIDFVVQMQEINERESRSILPRSMNRLQCSVSFKMASNFRNDDTLTQNVSEGNLLN
ncbi:hypothetical protein BLOT_014364, partial [Blomia tropicalis]